MADRIGDWIKFQEEMLRHLVIYCEAQYGVKEGQDDQLDSWNARKCMDAIERYVSRFGKNVRGPVDQLRDLVKIAHYAQICFDKLTKELEIPSVYPYAEMTNENVQNVRSAIDKLTDEMMASSIKYYVD